MTPRRLTVQAAVRGHHEWLVHRTACALTTDFNAIEAIDSKGRIRGMVGYCNWTLNSVQLHMAVASPSVWRSLLVPALEYPFVQVGVEVCLGLIPEDNARSARFAKRVGFTEVHRVKDGWCKGEDLLVLELRKEACRFLASPFGRAA